MAKARPTIRSRLIMELVESLLESRGLFCPFLSLLLIPPFRESLFQVLLNLGANKIKFPNTLR